MTPSLWIWVGLAVCGLGIVFLGYAQRLRQAAAHQELLDEDFPMLEDAVVELSTPDALELPFSDEWTLSCVPTIHARRIAPGEQVPAAEQLHALLAAAVGKVAWAPLADGPAPDRDLSTYLLQQLVGPLATLGLEPEALRLDGVQVVAEVELPTAPFGDGRQWVLGREGDLVVSGPGVSRRHLLVREENGQWMVMDLGSANGTRVRGQRLTPNVPVVVGPGDLLVLGRATPVDLSHLMG
jgi:hypothetical protein